jgi:hypothetical protein
MPEVMDAVRGEWQRRVVAEYASAAVTHSLLGWLLELGASPTLLHEGARIFDDELVHAEMAHAVLSAAGGGNVVLGGGLGLRREAELSLLGNVCLHGTRIFCLGETVAVRLFKRLRDGATVDIARQALDRVLADEVRHRDFGWLLLEWFSQKPDWPSLKALIEQRLPRWFSEIHSHYGQPSVEPFVPAARAWGLMPHADYAAAVAETMERDYIPRFAEYGIDARTAAVEPS